MPLGAELITITSRTSVIEANTQLVQLQLEKLLAEQSYEALFKRKSELVE